MRRNEGMRRKRGSETKGRLTARIYSHDPNIPPSKFTRQQRHQMIRRSFRGCIRHHINIRRIMKTCNTARDHHHASSLISSLPTIPEVQLPSSVEQVKQSNGEEIVRHSINVKTPSPVLMLRRPKRRLKF